MTMPAQRRGEASASPMTKKAARSVAAAAMKSAEARCFRNTPTPESLTIERQQRQRPERLPRRAVIIVRKYCLAADVAAVTAEEDRDTRQQSAPLSQIEVAAKSSRTPRPADADGG